MKVHIRTKDFYRWFRIHQLRIAEDNSADSMFEICNSWDSNCHLMFGKYFDQVLSLKKRNWVSILEQYLESKSLKCQILDFWEFNEVRIDEQRQGFNITLLVQFYGESNMDDLEISQ